LRPSRSLKAILASSFVVVFGLLLEIETLLLGGSVVLILEVLANAPTVDGSGDSPDYIAARVLELLESELPVLFALLLIPFLLRYS
jgi:hypothetical protein